MRNNDFNYIAQMYDGLAKAVFGKSIVEAQIQYLAMIPPDSSVLVIGGGTGILLKHLDKLNKNLSVLYVDASSNMIRRSKGREPFSNLDILFKTGTHLDLPPKKFDVIITNFFLDVFAMRNLPRVIELLFDHLSFQGLWMLTDFQQTSGRWQNALIRMMYWFFRVTTNLEGNTLLNFDFYLRQHALIPIAEKGFYHDMIQSKVFKKV